MLNTRYDRFHESNSPEEIESLSAVRNPARRDRDRILYTSAFRRLADVTQVVSPSEGRVFHNRLTHTLKVAQIGRSLAETLIRKNPLERQGNFDDLDPDVVEAAALAHDLGHPPFGHVAEKTLHTLLRDEISDGFEGNAQSFRIVTKLAVHKEYYPGLNLTRATLNATLKYPWLHSSEEPANRKWGAYSTEVPTFHWVRSGVGAQRSLEAQIMDWADDVAYSVHDAEDFYRAGLIPLDKLGSDNSLERYLFVDSALQRLKRVHPSVIYDEDRLRTVFFEVADTIPVDESYSGTTRQRAALRSWTSDLISSYIAAASLTLGDPGHRDLLIEERVRLEVTMLKELIWHYVIDNPSLATQQYAQEQVIRKLFSIYMDAATSKPFSMFPHSYRESLEKVHDLANQERTRVVVDFIASMTERQALDLYQRLAGTSLTSALNPIGL